MAAPRLLDKKFVTAEVAKQKTQQIKEGLAIAKKVDAVRESLQTEEKNLETFRTQSITRVHQEIDSKIAERDLLEGKLIPMRAEYVRLLTPPDLTEARADVEKKRIDLEEGFNALQENRNELAQGVALNILRERENKFEKGRIEDERSSSSKLLIETNALKEDALKELLSARSEASKIVSEARAREKIVSEKERELEQREISLDRTKEIVDSHEEDLAKREKKLKANQDVFIKSQQYLKNKK